MTQTPWPRIAEVFDAALDVSPSSRGAWLDQACVGDPALLDEVLALLAAHEDQPDFLDHPATPVLDALDDLEGAQLGAWHLEERIGEGGMGSVYRARRADGQYRQLAALKLIRPGRAGEAFAARFRAERQILASLDHPAIARLLDGGTTDGGQPYLVMEYVQDGVPIDEHCDRCGLDLEARLHLFRQVCAAVAHAHGRLVVHRDLKPSNILVGPDGQPKLLDFGVAKVLDPVMAGVTVAETRAGLVPLSLACAAPEQVRGEAVTTATDVYGLGMLLYRLLAGGPPFALDALALGEITKLISEAIPPPPSTAEGGPVPARGLEGDLDSIVLKALRKRPADRYPTVEALSADVMRYLEHRPVLARSDTMTYLVRRFVRRNRVWVGVAALVGIAMVLAVVFSTWQARVARMERDRARVEEQRALRLTQLVEQLFVQTDPALKEGGEPITALEVLERGRAEVAQQLADEPDVQADLLAVLGRVYLSLGDYPEAVDLHEQALALRRQLYASPHERLAQSQVDLAAARRGVWEWEQAQASAREGLAQWLDLAGPTDPRTLQAKVELARALSDQTGEDDEAMAEARVLFTEALVGFRALEGDRSEDIGGCLFGLGHVARFRGEFDAAADAYQQAADSFSAAGLPVRQAEALEGVSVALGTKGDLGPRYQAAIADALDTKERVLGPEHPLLADSLINAGAARYYAGDYDGAVVFYERALTLLRRAHGTDEEPLTLVMGNLAMAQLHRGEPDAARDLLEAVLAIRTRAHGPDDISTVAIEANLARVLLHQGELERAEALARHAVATFESEFGDHVVVARQYALLGSAQRARGQARQAEASMWEALHIYDRVHPEGHYEAAGPAEGPGVTYPLERR